MTTREFGSLVRKCRNLRKSLGIRCAAGFMRNRGVPLNDTLRTLGFPVRFAD